MTKNSLSVLVQMDPLENINFNSDSTISIIEEGLKRGHNIFFVDLKIFSFHHKEKK